MEKKVSTEGKQAVGGREKNTVSTNFCDNTKNGTLVIQSNARP